MKKRIIKIRHEEEQKIRAYMRKTALEKFIWLSNLKKFFQLAMNKANKTSFKHFTGNNR